MIQFIHRLVYNALLSTQIASIATIIITKTIIQSKFTPKDNVTNAKEGTLGILIQKNAPNANLTNTWILKESV